MKQTSIHHTSIAHTPALHRSHRYGRPRRLAWLMACCTLLIVAGSTFTACDSDDDYDTDQYTGGISLNVFGPSPIVRGGTLRFLGSNLDRIVQVVIPGVDPITDITVVASGTHSEIRVTVPVDGPEEGYVQLVADTGETLTTASILTYEETILLDSFSPASVMAGDVLTIEGDYLNLIQEVIFCDDVIVTADDFLSHDRYTITVTVPREAQTGVITLADGDSTDEEEIANLIASDEELVVGTPTVTALTTDSRLKAGATLTLTGTRLDLVDYVAFEGATIPSQALAEDDTTYFTLNDEGTAITLTQPVEAAQGDITLVLASGVEVTAIEAADFPVVTPSNLVITSQRLKAGLELTLEGEDLDLVTGITFASGVDGGDFSVEGETLLTVSAIPSGAVDGDLTLGMANGMSASVAYTLVQPTVTGYSEAKAGEEVTLYGTDLDLVASISFGGGSAAEPGSVEVTGTDSNGADLTTLTVTIPTDSESGTVVLTLANGATVEAPELTIEGAAFCAITELPDDITAGEVITVTVVNGDVLTGVEVGGEAVTYILSGETLYIAIPGTADGSTTLRLISSNGEVSYTIDVYNENSAGTVIWTGSYVISGWNGWGDLSWGGYDWSQLSVGNTLIITYELDDTQTYWQMRVAKGSGWSALAGTEDPYNLEAGSTSLELVLTEAMLSELVDEGGLILTGTNFTVTQVAYK